MRRRRLPSYLESTPQTTSGINNPNAEARSSVTAQPKLATAEFQYVELSDPSKYIRLLTLDEHVGSEGEAAFRVRVVALEDSPKYLALSYYWGDPTPIKNVQVDQKILKVNKSLSQFLSTLIAAVKIHAESEVWDVNEELFIWVDYICINQSDLLEKSHQVKMMGEIYKRAEKVIGYIGDCPKTGTVAGLAAMASLSGLRECLHPLTGKPLSEVPPNAAEALRELWNQEWYMRSWVVQEVVLAKSVVCLYGNETDCLVIDLGVLAGMVDRASDGSYHHPQYAEFWDDDTGGRQSQRMVQLDTWRRLRTLYRDGTLTPCHLLYRTRSAEATDPRDKIYSVLSLMSEDELKAIDVKYSPSHTVQEVYKQFARQAVVSNERMMLLYNAGIDKRIPDLPSWVPDWSFQPAHRLDETLYKATGILEAIPAAIALSEDGNKISLPAIGWDVIEGISIPYLRHEDNGESSTREDVTLNKYPRMSSYQLLSCMEYALYDMCEHVRKKHNRYPCNAELNEVIWKTLIADRGWGDRRGGDVERKAYEAFLTTLPRGDPAAHLQLLGEKGVQEQLFPLWLMTERAQCGRVLGYTARGDVGTFPAKTQRGDIVAAFLCASLLFVLRPHSDGDFEIVGTCYVHGHMDGLILYALNVMNGGWNNFVTNITLR